LPISAFYVYSVIYYSKYVHMTRCIPLIFIVNHFDLLIVK